MQQCFIIASRLRAVGLITFLCYNTLSLPGPPPCCYTGSSVCHFLLLHWPLQSSVFVCVWTCCAHPEMGGWGSSQFHREQYPFWCISALFVSLTRTNRPMADRRRMKWRVRNSEWGGDETVKRPSSLGTQDHLIISQCFMAVVASSCIVDWIVDCSAYLLSCGLRCVVISSTSLLAQALSVLQPLSPILFTYREEAYMKKLSVILENIAENIDTVAPI